MKARWIHRSLTTLAASVAVLALAACGSDSGGGGSAVSSTDAPTATQPSNDGGSSTAPSTDTSSPAEPLTWVIIAPLSGAAAGYGEGTVSGFKASANMINEAGGINGRQVEIVGVDDAYDPSKAVTALQDYIAKNGNPDMVFPGISSAETLALLPVTTEAKIFTVDYSASSDLSDVTKYPYAFHTFMPANQLAGGSTTSPWSLGRQELW